MTFTRSKERAVYFLSFMLALSFLVPDNFLPWPAFRHDVVVGVGLAPLLFCLAWKRIEIPKEGALLMAFSIFPLLQIATGKILFSGDGWISWLYLSSAALALIAGSNLVRGSNSTAPLEEIEPLIVALVFAAIISVGISLAQWVGLELSTQFIASLPSGSRPSANIGQPNQLATLLLIGLAGIYFLFENKKLHASLAICASIFLLLGLAITRSRTVFLSLVFVWIFYFGFRHQAKLQLSKKSLLFLTGLFVLFSLLLPLLEEFLFLKNSASMVERTAKDVRFDLWLSMIDAIFRAPWAGYGWGQIPIAQQIVALDHPATYAFFDSAHNIFLDIAISAGLPVALIFAGFLFAWVRRQLTACRDPLVWSILLAVGMVFCHAMVEYPLAYAYILIPISFFMGALGPQKSENHANSGARSYFSNFLFSILCAISLAGFFAISVEYIKFESEWRQIRFAIAGLASKNTMPAIHKSVFLSQLDSYAGFYKINPDRGMSEGEIDEMRKVSMRFGNPAVLMRYAVANALNGRGEAAANSLALICKTQPPRVCKQMIGRWQSISVDPAYSELKKISLPDFVN